MRETKEYDQPLAAKALIRHCVAVLIREALIRTANENGKDPLAS